MSLVENRWHWFSFFPFPRETFFFFLQKATYAPVPSVPFFGFLDATGAGMDHDGDGVDAEELLNFIKEQHAELSSRKAESFC